MKYIKRDLESTITRKLKTVPVIAVIGPRQSGKSTLIKNILENRDDSLYLDLERPSDLNKLRDAESYFTMNKDKLICLDEIQRMPEIFPLIRSLVDANGRKGQFIILGSASAKLLKQSSESLAGRITYLELTPFLISEIAAKKNMEKIRLLWLRGGFPRSYLAENDLESLEWRNDFIRTFTERDIPLFGFNIPNKGIERIFSMCAHMHGQILNRSKLGEALGVSHHTIQHYLEILSETFLLRILRPYEKNTKKRIIKSPKTYIRDSGLLHALLHIKNQDDLFGHPAFGASWEGFALENIVAELPGWETYFYRSASGDEIDLIIENGKKRYALEFKASAAPTVGKGFYNTSETLAIDAAWIICPIEGQYPFGPNVTVSSPLAFLEQLKA